MKKLLTAAVTAAGLATAALAGGTGTANATGYQDSQYVNCVGYWGIYSYAGPADMAFVGQSIANDIWYGRRDPLQERNWVYYNTPASINIIDSNVLVNCATQTWLGYGSEGPHNSYPNYGSQVV
jgi:hypothetical protein